MESQNVSEQASNKTSSKAHVLLFTSGKRRVGKTFITANVASAMTDKGTRVCILDADKGSTNIAAHFDLNPEFTLEHVLNGEKSLADITLKTIEGIAVIPGAGEIGDHSTCSERRTSRFSLAVSELQTKYDFILIDSGSGITLSDKILRLVDSAPCTFLVITTEPPSLSDTFSLLKQLNTQHRNRRLRAVVNQAPDYTTAIETYRRFASTVEKYLNLNIEYGGFVAYDAHTALTMPRPTAEHPIQSPAGRCLTALAGNILKFIGPEQSPQDQTDFPHHELADDELFTNPVNRATTIPPELTHQSTISIADLLKNLLIELKVQSPTREHMETFIADFVTIFVAKHGIFPESFKPLFYRWLESENHAAPRLMELVATLESLYASRYRQPLFNLEDSAARLVAQTQGSESKLRELIYQLHAAYRQAFQSDMLDARQEILKTIQQDDFTEERFEDLLVVLQAGFQNRFGRPYRGQSALLLESTAEALAEIADDEIKLQNEILQLSQNFQQLTARREALLSAIENAQNSELALKPIGTMESSQD